MSGVNPKPSGADEFSTFVDALAATLIRHSPTFESFVIAMPGVLPDEALAALHRIPGADAARLIADARVDRAGPRIDQCVQLPLPHPLDSEFRFDTATAEILATALVDATVDGDELLLIGVPTVAVVLSGMNVDRRIRFLGPDNSVTSAVRLVFRDDRFLLDQGEGRTAAAALVDPPWYRPAMRELIRVSASGCRAGARLNLILPPIGTRPDVVADREACLGFAQEAGLRSTGRGGPVSYRTPLFELAAMERQGIARLANWRRGETREFVVASQCVPFAEWMQPRSPEFMVGGIRLMLAPRTGAGPDELVPIGSHEVFPSVSARAPGRNAGTLWTTTNRAFAVDFKRAHDALATLAGLDPEVLLSGFRMEKNDLALPSGVAAESKLIQQLVELVGREGADARRLVGDGAWHEMAMEWRS
jgi:hypothetical protein